MIETDRAKPHEPFVVAENELVEALVRSLSDAQHRVDECERQLGVDHDTILELTQQQANDRDQIAHLTTALHTARLIGSAVGILMATHRITGDASFDLLRSASQNGHEKLRDVADYVFRTGTLPE